MRALAAIACLATVLLAWPAQVRAERHALLVGVGRYANLDAGLQLRGPANDVANMRQALIRLGWKADRVRQLVDADATRAAILSAFQGLAARSAPGDLVAVYLGGHGTQAPARNGRGLRQEEPDYLDELFLPTNAGKWNRGIGRVDDAIYDDEFDELITAIRRRGASVWLIADTCHAGTITRTGDDHATRSVPPSAVGIPPEALPIAVERLSESANAARIARPLDLEPGTGSLTAFFATDAAGEATEADFPRADGGKVRMGLFTRALADVLAEATPADTYQAILERVRARIGDRGRQGTPQMIGRNSAIPFLEVSPAKAAPPERPAVLGIFDAIGDGKTMSVLARAALPHRVELRSASRDSADLVLRLCDGHPTLSRTDAPPCDASGRQSMKVDSLPSGAMGEYLCRAAYAAQLSALSRRDTLPGAERAGIEFGIAVEARSGSRGGIRSPEPRLRQGDLLRPWLRTAPGAPPVQFAVFLVDGRGQASLKRSSHDDPIQQPTSADIDFSIPALCVSTAPGDALGRETLVMMVATSAPDAPGWNWAPACGIGDAPRLLPTGRIAVKRLTWISEPSGGGDCSRN